MKVRLLILIVLLSALLLVGAHFSKLLADAFLGLNRPMAWDHFADALLTLGRAQGPAVATRIRAAACVGFGLPTALLVAAVGCLFADRDYPDVPPGR